MRFIPLLPQESHGGTASPPSPLLSTPLLSGVCLELPDPPGGTLVSKGDRGEPGKAEQVSYKALLQGPVGAWQKIPAAPTSIAFNLFRKWMLLLGPQRAQSLG